MKRYILLLLLGFVCACAGSVGRIPAGSAVPQEHANSDRTGDSREECLRSIRRARLDARSGLYRMYVFGPKRYDAMFSRFMEGYMKTKYGIELILFGDDDRNRDKCYSNEMDKIIYNAFGPDVLARAELEAHELFDQGR
jgi:hypothetical protein